MPLALDAWLLSGLLIGHVGDVSSTTIALHNPNLREGNFLLKHPTTLYGVNAAVTFGEYKLLRKKSKRTKIIVVGTLCLARGFLTYRNLRLANSK